MRPETLRELSTQARCRFKTETPSEIGGVLWGKAGPDDSVVILDATLLPAAGPLFNSTSSDLRKIAHAVHGRAPGAHLCLVGYFRSHIREDLCLSPQDQALIEREIQDPDAVFLIIKPFDIGICMAGFFFWQNGRLQVDSSELEIPFVAMDEISQQSSHERQPRAPQFAKSIDTRSEKALTATAQKNDPEPGEPSIVSILRESALRNSPLEKAAAKAARVGDLAPARESGKRPWWPLAVATALISALVSVAGFGAYWAWPALRSRLQSAIQKPPEAGINLEIARGPRGQLNLSWNRNALQAGTAQSATLEITDGRRSQNVKLDGAQLRSRKLVYFPKSSDVQFRLELLLDNGLSSTDSVRVLSPGIGMLGGKRHPVGHHLNPITKAGLIATTPDARAPATTSGPDAGLSSGIPSGPNAASLPLLRPVFPARTLVTATTLAAPASGSTGTYEPPKAIEEMMPETAPEGQFAQVEVEVSINPAGHVTAAHAVENGKTIGGALAASAIASAKKWVFEPAILEGKPVPAKYTIVFAFHPILR
jgi:hypothetical protein